jgi:hypothetical protein
MKKIRLIFFIFISVSILSILACCIFYKCQGIEKVVIPKHVMLNPSLYTIVAEQSCSDTLFKTVYYKGKK